MKKFFIVLAVFGIVFSSCSFIKEIRQKPLVDEKLRVVATNTVLYDFAKSIGGEHVNVSLFAPDGIDPKTDVFIYAGDFVDPWAESILESANETDLTVIDSSIDVEMDNDDPNFWTDPKNEQIMIENIASGFIVADPKNRDYYQRMTEKMEAKFKELKAE